MYVVDKRHMDNARNVYMKYTSNKVNKQARDIWIKLIHDYCRDNIRGDMGQYIKQKSLS